MNEQDFYKLNIGQEIYYKGEKDKIDYLVSLSCGCIISLTKLHETYVWKEICQDCSLEPPFEVKKDCKYYCKSTDGEPDTCIYERDYYWIDKEKNCYNCEHYEEKHELKKWYKIEYFEETQCDVWSYRKVLSKKPFVGAGLYKEGNIIWFLKMQSVETDKTLLDKIWEMFETREKEEVSNNIKKAANQIVQAIEREKYL